MTSRLVLCLGDLFIPDRANASLQPLSPLQSPANKHNRTFPQRYFCHLPSTTHLASNAPRKVQKTPHTRQNRPNPLLRQPHIPLCIHLPPQPSPRPATSKRRLRHLPLHPRRCCTNSLRPTNRSTPHPYRTVKSSNPRRLADWIHTRAYNRTPRRP
jgi:hypothetical protein